jgi:hypothetical protein
MTAKLLLPGGGCALCAARTIAPGGDVVGTAAALTLSACLMSTATVIHQNLCEKDRAAFDTALQAGLRIMQSGQTPGTA